MTDTMPEQMTELGPVDWVILEFPGSKFRGEMAPILADLVDRGVVRVLDLVLVTKEMDGTVEARELTDADAAEIGALREMKSDLTLLSEQDVTSAAAAIAPGSTAALLVWENTWAAPFATAVRRAGGELVATGRVPVPVLLAALEEDLADEEEGD
jgi:hypothetical protein